MRKFKVTVDGQEYAVTVEEVSGSAGAPVAKKEEPRPAAAPPSPAAPKPPAAAPAPAPGAAPVSAAGGTAIPSPMPGSIIDVKVKVGDTVSAGDVVVILEAMKMENEVTAPAGGTVIQVAVKKGDTVNSGDPLVIVG